jgi:hypothetical protein
VLAQEAAVTGKDAYTVFHSMFRSVNKTGEGQTYLDQVNFVSRFSLLLFGGELGVDGSKVSVGGFLKFKIGSGGEDGAVMVKGLRKVIEKVMLERLGGGGKADDEANERWKRTVAVVLQLMEEEKH